MMQSSTKNILFILFFPLIINASDNNIPSNAYKIVANVAVNESQSKSSEAQTADILKSEDLTLEINQELIDTFPFFDLDLFLAPIPELKTTPTCILSPNRKKDWTVLIYIAADNDLKRFAYYNIEQMKKIGSSSFVNVIIELHTSKSKHEKKLERFLVSEGKLFLLKSLSTPQNQIDSGKSETLSDFCTWSIENYPAENIGLILWNHGIGIIDPVIRKYINPNDLFSFNPTSNMFELNRSVEFLDFVGHLMEKNEERGICFDDSTGNYLTNENLEQALKDIVKATNNKKLAFLGFDACLMSMIEIMAYAHLYADIMIASEEVELGPGWNYAALLAPLKKKSLSKEVFAKYIVEVYQKTYCRFIKDFTLSAVNLAKIQPLLKNVDQLAKMLQVSLQKQSEQSVLKTIKLSRHKNMCTHFEEPSYIDLDHFYSNLYENINRCTFNSTIDQSSFIKEIQDTIKKGRNYLAESIIANSAGPQLNKAKGIAIYFPEIRIHSSYYKTQFSLENNWAPFLRQFLNAQFTPN